MQVQAWSQNLTPEKAAAHGVQCVSKEALFSSADIVSIHLILSQRTRGLIGAPELALMKPTARLVNTSRGPIVVEKDPVDVLSRCAIAGAAIDVYDHEPLPPDHPFRVLPNVLATPHIGYVTEGLYHTFYQDTVSNIANWLDRQAGARRVAPGIAASAAQPSGMYMIRHTKAGEILVSCRSRSFAQASVWPKSA
ncbi:hypothetical protein RM96_23820 [Cupriavidus sp. IDO]|nr:hypothetical protein RM96_23820 [Cupriavidus sp. IDO]